jgi:hypothetical protein
MRIKTTILFVLIFSSIAWGQNFKSSLPSKTNDTLFIFIDSLQTTDIDYFNLTPKMIKKVNVIKSEEQKYIYGNPKGGTVLISLKRRYKSVKIGEILRKDFCKTKTVQFFIDNLVKSNEEFLQTSIKDFGRIEFVKKDTIVYEIRITKLTK